MPQFSTTRRVNHPPAAMFDLVADVAHYPEFVPLCLGLEVLSRRALNESQEEILAVMQVGYKAIRERFTSKVILDRTAMQIHVSYIDGPFQKMDNLWQFLPVVDASGQVMDGACDVSFSISYEFKSRTLSLLMGAMFDKAFRKFSSAFEARADALYGKVVAG